MKKILVVILALMLMLANIAVLAEAAGNYTEGEYLGVGQGNNGDVQVKVVLSQDSILSVTVESHQETAGISDAAIAQIPARIVESQSLAVDTVAGATRTSEAIVAAVEDCIAAAGGNVQALKVEKAVEVAAQPVQTVVRQADVIVVGTGAAGLSAGATVLENGGSVILIDKMPSIGGNSSIAGGTLNAVDSARQEPLGYKDSVELFVQNVCEGGGNLGNLELIQVLCENATDARYWIEGFGGKWKNEVYQTIGGLFPRSLDAEVNSYQTIVSPLNEYILKNGGEVITNMYAYELIEENGRVTGVKARDTVTGTEHIFNAENGVVLATGGYAANLDMINEYLETPIDVEGTTNLPCATGDGITMALGVNANLVGMEYVQMVPAGKISFVNDLARSIYVSPEGKRFVNETGTRKEICDAVVKNEGSMMYVIFDSNTITEGFSSILDGGLTINDYIELSKEGKCGYGATIEEAAACVGLDGEQVTKTVAEYNAMVEAGASKDEFGRTYFGGTISDGPFYISVRTVARHYTMGGVEIDNGAHVIDQNGSVIKGLYAAGEVTGGIHGNNRVGGNALTDCVVFGRIAGENAMQQK